MARSAIKEVAQQLRPLFDPEFYLAKYPDIAATRLDPLTHFARFGLGEGRNPNPFFDGAWYVTQNPDVAAAGIHPLLHYLTTGAAELRNPHPRFDAAFYAEEHPEAAANPLLFHLLAGRARGFATEPAFDLARFLPSAGRTPSCPRNVRVDVIIPCYRGVAETRRCLESVLADPDRPPGRVLAIDDASPEPELSALLDRYARDGRIVLLRSARNLGFVGSVNRGMAAAGRADVALLNSDTEAPPGWLRRLAGHAYSGARIASVSPLSNNATICSYPALEGGEPAFGLGTEALDQAAQAANAGRSIKLPVTVGFCMYIRRAALDDVGAFDEAAFGFGYGEECDFCHRATARGWEHRLACDTYVHHEAERSFGARAAAARAAGEAILSARWPQHRELVARHIMRGAVEPFRFALTAELYRRSGLPVILLVSHALGGGVERHVSLLAQQVRGRANLLMVRPSGRGALLSAPSLPGHCDAAIPAERVEAMVAALASAGVARAHVHHVMGADFDVRALLRGLDVPFDLTVHDWFLICPQVNLLPRLDGQYCGEPDQAGCNACIAARPSQGAKEILAWRADRTWMLREADRILCPSEDAHGRIARHGWGRRAILAPHEPAPGAAWNVLRPPLSKGEPLRIALLGVLAAQKGLATVASFVEAADPARFSLHLIGHPEQELPRGLRGRIQVTGRYEEEALSSLIAQASPHIIWFPAQWPETWSYTLSAALEACLPVVASRIGAFPERLAERPLTWLVDPDAPAQAWIAAFEAVRTRLRSAAALPASRRRELPAFYPDAYLEPLERSRTESSRTITPLIPARAQRRAGIHRRMDARSGGHDDGGADKPISDRERNKNRLKVIVIPERFETTGMPTPCAYIRLLQPLSHPGVTVRIEMIVAGPDEALGMEADLIVTHRHAAPDLGAAEALIRHCRKTGMKLVYDLDDDLLRPPPGHADAAVLADRAATVRRFLARADAVWVSTPGLARQIGSVRKDARIMPNGLDERLWRPRRTLPLRPNDGRVRILLMGTTTHDADFALIEPALRVIRRRYRGRVSVDMIGISSREDLPRWIGRLWPPGVAAYSYPGFVDWITRLPPWDIGLAPLADSAFNRAKSALKALDYAALGLAVLASDVETYRGSIADGQGGWLVRNDRDAWVEALDRVIRLDRTRTELAANGRAALIANDTLAAQARKRLAELEAICRAPIPRRPSIAAERQATSCPTA